MASDKKNRKKGITPEKVLAWSYKKAKMPNEQISQILGIAVSSIYRYLDEVDDFVGHDLDVAPLRNNLLGLYGKAVAALDKLLEDANPKTVSDFFNGLGIWAGKHDFTVKDTRDKSTDDLIDEFTKLTGFKPTRDEEGEPDIDGATTPS